MNNIGFGFFCFGDEYYYKGAVEKIRNILSKGFHCYVLTENPVYFTQHVSSMYLHIIQYDRSFKSYSDKMILPKYILKQHQFAVLIDTDTHITNYDVIDKLKNYNFKDGISYVDTLENHVANKKYVKELIQPDHMEWSSYHNYVKGLYPSYGELECMWEYFLVINKNGLNLDQSYHHYERLQLCKESCDLGLNKKVNGAGEGISIQVSCILSGSKVQRDLELYNVIKNNMYSVSRRHTKQELWPDWMK